MRTIVMLDEDGKPFNRTYPRRADNLVRKGRARWVDSNSIALTTSPVPSQDLEDEGMSDTAKIEMLLEQVLDRIAKLEEKLESLTIGEFKGTINTPNVTVNGEVRFEAGVETVSVSELKGEVTFASEVDDVFLEGPRVVKISDVNSLQADNCKIDIGEANHIG